IIPHYAHVGGTVRTLKNEVQALVVRRLEEICAGIGAAFGASVELNYIHGYPATVNDEKETAFAVSVARSIAIEGMVNDQVEPVMGAEDFAYMLQERPGSYMSIGQGEGAPLHHPEYDFNDELSPIGASYFVKLVEMAQPLA
ncbi:MAG: M20/M25/M40 family metallo-hydrolase, partial [Paracoccaceae bacterium]